MSKSILNSQVMRGPLANQGAVKKKSTRAQKNLVFSINMTALIDAFAILVIFLLSNYSGDSHSVNASNKITLPTATQAEILTMGTVVKLEGNKIFVDEKEIRFRDLVTQLIEARKSKESESDDIKNSLIIQADRSIDFDVLSPVIQAGGSAGFNQYKFAAMPK